MLAPRIPRVAQVPSETEGGIVTDLPRDEVTAMDAAAIRLHEAYQSLRRAGFSKPQAESLVAELVVEEFNGPTEVP